MWTTPVEDINRYAHARLLLSPPAKNRSVFFFYQAVTYPFVHTRIPYKTKSLNGCRKRITR
jgi:hypothetical protein